MERLDRLRRGRHDAEGHLPRAPSSSTVELVVDWADAFVHPNGPPASPPTGSILYVDDLHTPGSRHFNVQHNGTLSCPCRMPTPGSARGRSTNGDLNRHWNPTHRATYRPADSGGGLGAGTPPASKSAQSALRDLQQFVIVSRSGRGNIDLDDDDRFPSHDGDQGRGVQAGRLPARPDSAAVGRRRLRRHTLVTRRRRRRSGAPAGGAEPRANRFMLSFATS